MKRSKRLSDEYDPHVAQFIRAKLIMPKSKNLDKVRVYVDTRFSDDSWMMPIEQDEEDDESASTILSKTVSGDKNSVQNNPKYSRRISVFLDRDDGEATSSQTVPEKDGESILANGEALIGSKAENMPLQKLVRSKPPYVITQRCFIDIFKACLGYVHTMANEHKKLNELAKKLTTTEERAIANLKKSLATARKKTSEVEESSHLALDEHSLATTQLEDQVKVLRDHVTKLEEQYVADVTFYDGLCFDAISRAWSSNGRAQPFNWSAFP
uniref:Uncharacterized protein n=1 Tax=Cannabis sativa TaxID=3483 RepID=A0A803Q0Y3_CANSA